MLYPFDKTFQARKNSWREQIALTGKFAQTLQSESIKRTLSPAQQCLHVFRVECVVSLRHNDQKPDSQRIQTFLQDLFK